MILNAVENRTLPRSRSAPLFAADSAASSRIAPSALISKARIGDALASGANAIPARWTTLSGRTLSPADMDIVVRVISSGQPHRATPLTGALCFAVATRIEGSLAAAMARGLAPDASQIRIAHPSGVIVVDACVRPAANATAQPHAEYAAVYRTARRLFEGRVLYRA